MRAKVSQEVNDAFAELAPNRKFQTILKWLKEELDNTREQNDTLEGINLTRSQGSCMVLSKIIKTASEAE